MIKLKNVAIAATMIFGLSAIGGCQYSQSGSSTYGGVGFGNKVVGKNVLSRATIGPLTKVVEEDAVTPAYFGNSNSDAKPAKKKSKAAKKAGKVKKARARKKTITRKSVKVRRKVVSLKKGPRKVRSAAKVGTGRGKYDALIRHHAKANGVPYALARAVVQVESGFRPGARGKVGEIGLMQLRSRTARGMGYRGSSKGLYNPATNIKYGMRYLGKAYRLGGRSTCGAILKYNAGHGAKRMNPISRRYCSKVRRIIKG